MDTLYQFWLQAQPVTRLVIVQFSVTLVVVAFFVVLGMFYT